MSSPGTSYPDNAGVVLIKVQDELRQLREQLEQLATDNNHGNASITTTVRQMQAAMAKTEETIQQEAERTALQSQHHIRTVPAGALLPSLPHRARERHFPEGGTFNAFPRLSNRPSIAMRSLTGLFPSLTADVAGPSPGQRTKLQREKMILSVPTRNATRRTIEIKYGSLKPKLEDSPPERNPAPKPRSRRVDPWLRSDPLTVLPKANRRDAQLTPPPITEEEAKRGLLSLFQRGLIAPNSDILLDPPPVQHKQLQPLDERRPKGAFADERDAGGVIYLAADTEAQRSPRTPAFLDQTGLRSYSSLASNTSSALHSTPTESLSAKPSLSKLDHVKDPTSLKNRRVPLSVVTVSMNTFNEAGLRTSDMQQVRAHPNTTQQMLRPGCRIAIQHGYAVSKSPEFKAFKEAYAKDWGNILTLLDHFGVLLRKYSIPLVFVNTEQFAKLSREYEMEERPPFERLLDCCFNGEDVKATISQPTQRFRGEDRQDQAAIVIQAWYRMLIKRKEWNEHRKMKWAAGVIGMAFLLRLRRKTLHMEAHQSAIEKQTRQIARMRTLSRKWSDRQMSRPLVIHLPSRGHVRHVRSVMREFQILQNCQIGRICSAADDGQADVLYISPVNVSDEMKNYNANLLDMAQEFRCQRAKQIAMKRRESQRKAQRAASLAEDGFEEELSDDFDEGSDEESPSPEVPCEKPSDRLQYFEPQAMKFFETHNLPLSTLMYYSANTLPILRNHVCGRTAYIIPDLMCDDDMRIADALDIPVLSAPLQVTEMINSKSGARKIFEESQVDCAPGVGGLKSEPTLINQLSRLLAANLSVRQWLFKINDEVDGRGLAVFDSVYMPSYGWALRERRRYGEKWKKTWAQAECRQRYNSELMSTLSNHATPLNKKAYPTWPVYLDTILRKGGTVEARAPAESITMITADVYISPDGNVVIKDTVDQLQVSQFKCIGYTMPQTSVEPSKLAAAAMAIGKCCQVHGVVGYLSIDFITFFDEAKKEQQLWAVDLKHRYGNSMALSQLAMYMSASQFHAETGIVHLDKSLHDEFSEECNDRYAVMSCELRHSNMAIIQYPVFFHMCQAHGIGYNMKNGTGTVFQLTDGVKKHAIGMVCIADNLPDALRMFRSNLSVIHQEISPPKLNGVNNFKVMSEEIDKVLALTAHNLQADDLSKSDH